MLIGIISVFFIPAENSKPEGETTPFDLGYISKNILTCFKARPGKTRGIILFLILCTPINAIFMLLFYAFDPKTKPWVWFIMGMVRLTEYDIAGKMARCVPKNEISAIFTMAGIWKYLVFIIDPLMERLKAEEYKTLSGIICVVHVCFYFVLKYFNKIFERNIDSNYQTMNEEILEASIEIENDTESELATNNHTIEANIEQTVPQKNFATLDSEKNVND